MSEKDFRKIHHTLINQFNGIQGYIELLEFDPTDSELIEKIKEILPKLKIQIDAIIE